MSLLDQVRKLEQQLVGRLKELEPLTREYDQLRKLAQRLGVSYNPPAADAGEPAASAPPARSPAKAKAARSARGAKTAAKPGRPRAAARKPAAATARTPAARGAGRRRSAARPGERDDQVLQLVGERPGITVRELGERLGVDATGLYRVVKRLTDAGRIRKDGTALHPLEPAAGMPSSAAGEAGSAVAASPAAAPDV